MNAEAQLQSLVARLAEELQPTAIWLFGSRAEGRAQVDSDWDLILVSTVDVDIYAAAAPHRGKGMPFDLVGWKLDCFEVDRFLPGTLPYAAFTRGRELHRASGFAWGPPATPEALTAALDRWLDSFFEHAEDALRAQRILWANDVYLGTRRERIELGIDSETMPRWTVRSLLRALVMARGIDHGPTRKLKELLNLLPVGDPGRAIIAPMLLDDDDDDATGDPEILAAAIAATRAELGKVLPGAP